MKIYKIDIEHGVQLRIDYADSDMKFYDKLISNLNKHDDVTLIKKTNTFETPIHDYTYRKMPFSILFDEMVDETFVFVGKEYDYIVIEKLLQELI